MQIQTYENQNTRQERSSTKERIYRCCAIPLREINNVSIFPYSCALFTQACNSSQQLWILQQTAVQMKEKKKRMQETRTQSETYTTFNKSVHVWISFNDAIIRGGKFKTAIYLPNIRCASISWWPKQKQSSRKNSSELRTVDTNTEWSHPIRYFWVDFFSFQSMFIVCFLSGHPIVWNARIESC